MRSLLVLACSALVFTACDSNRLYEKNTDFKSRYWLVNEQPAFEFDVLDVEQPYNLYMTLRHESDYQNSNIYFTYYLQDSTGTELVKKLTSEFLFDKKTGEPLGASGLGDIYSHRFLLLDKYTFQNPGKYTIRYEQFMRTDTLSGVLSVGLRVEKASK